MRNPDPQSGVTLIEAMVASLVMAIGIVSILAVLPQSLIGVRSSGRKLVVNQLGAEKLEALRALDYAHADLAVGVHPAQASDSNGDRYYPVAGFDEDYSLRWIVTAGPTDGSGTAEPDMKTVTVESTYRVRYTLAGAPVPLFASIEAEFNTFLADLD